METYFKQKGSLRKDSNFSDRTRELFWQCYACGECKENSWDILHHIFNNGLNITSPLNACPLHNQKCHIGRALHGEQTRVKFLKFTYDYLKSIGYQLTQKDKEFISNNSRYYKQFLDLPLTTTTMEDEKKEEATPAEPVNGETAENGEVATPAEAGTEPAADSSEEASS